MGKFSANEKRTSDVYAVLAQREARAKKKPGAAMPRMEQKREPVPAPAPVEQPNRKRSVKGTLIFYLCCLIFVFVFYVATFVGLRFLRSWLVSFEAAQPTVKCQEVFDELFADPDWAELYALSGMEDGSYEGVDAFVTFMENKVGDSELTYLETSAGLSGDMKYVVWLGEEKLATFTLTDPNEAEGMTEVPDWQLGKVEFLLEGQERFRILMEEGCTAYVNGIALTDDQVVARRVSRSEEYLPTFAPKTRLQILEVDGLLTTPAVEIRDAQGQSLTVTFDAEQGLFQQERSAPELPEDRQQLALDTVKTYALYMSGKATRAQVGKYFDKTSDTYSAIMEADLNWVQKGSEYTFSDEQVTDYQVHGEDIFSVRVSVDLNITRTEDGSVKTTDITQSLFFAKNSSGDWVCYEMTAVDTTQWIEEVRLTFVKDGQVLSQEFVDAESATVSCPLVSAPEGKTLKGWTVEEKDESGRTVLRLVLAPDETGTAYLTSDTALEPMTLSPLFE